MSIQYAYNLCPIWDQPVSKLEGLIILMCFSPFLTIRKALIFTKSSTSILLNHLLLKQMVGICCYSVEHKDKR